MQLIIELAPLLALLAVAFGCGYGVREYIARRRNTAARKKFYEEHPDLRQLRGPLFVRQPNHSSFIADRQQSGILR